MHTSFQDNETLGKFTEPAKPAQSLDQILADLPRRGQVAKIIGFCEGICNSGILGADMTKKLRGEIAATLAAFDMPAKQDSFDRDLDVMERKS